MLIVRRVCNLALEGRDSRIVSELKCVCVCMYVRMYVCSTCIHSFASIIVGVCTQSKERHPRRKDSS